MWRKAISTVLLTMTPTSLAAQPILKATIPLKSKSTTRFALHQDHQWLAVEGVYGSVDVYSTATYKLVKRLPLPGDTTSMVFSSNGQSLNVFVDSMALKSPLWVSFDTKTWKEKKPAITLDSPIIESHISADGKYLYGISDESVALRWDLKTSKTVRAFEEIHSVHLALPNAGDVGASFLTSDLHFVSLSSGKVLSRQFLKEGFAFSAMAFHPSGKTLALVLDSGNMTFWDSKTFKKTGEIKTSLTRVAFLNYSQDGKYLLAGQQSIRNGETGLIQLWDVENRKLLTKIEDPAQSSVWGRFSGDGKQIYVHVGSKIQIWDISLLLE